MKNNNGNRNRNQDQWRSSDRDWQNRNQGNTDYDERSRNRNQDDMNSNYDYDSNSNRFSDAGNFNSNYGGGTYGSNWNENRRGDSNDYNRQGRGDDMNKNWGSNDYNRSSRYGSSDYGRSGYGNQGSSRYGNRNDRNESDRSWWDKTSDEVSSWFGDDDAERRRRMDKINGPHRGKGPKGYTRSDEKIRDDINDKLYHDPFVDASDIDVTVSEGNVTLTGSVDSKETKRRAEDLAEEVTGVSDVSNNLKVNKTSSTWGTTQNDSSKSSSKDISESYRRN